MKDVYFVFSIEGHFKFTSYFLVGSRLFCFRKILFQNSLKCVHSGFFLAVDTVNMFAFPTAVY